LDQIPNLFIHLCQSLQDEKAKPRLELFALLPIVFRITNQRVKEALVNFEGLSQEGGQAELAENQHASLFK
jgi:hypothetical protein